MMENEQLTYNNLHWFEYRQNNSGGVFESNNDVSHFMFIQAESPDAANQRAEEVGIYFDGCEGGLDCYCCGDRWYRSHSAMTKFKTYHWREPITEYDNISDYAQAEANHDMWAKDGVPAVITYFADGSVKRFHQRKG